MLKEAETAIFLSSWAELEKVKTTKIPLAQLFYKIKLSSTEAKEKRNGEQKDYNYYSQ